MKSRTRPYDMFARGLGIFTDFVTVVTVEIFRTR